MMSALEGKADVPVLQRARKKALRVKNPETGTYPGCSAYSCRSLQPQISRKVRKFIRHFESSQVSQAFWRTDLTTSQCVKDRNSGPFTLGFCLHGPILHSESAKRPKVSSRLRNYSRFAETAPGDFGSIGTAGRPASWQRLLISLSSKKLISSDFGARLGVEAGTGLGKS